MNKNKVIITIILVTLILTSVIAFIKKNAYTTVVAEGLEPKLVIYKNNVSHDSEIHIAYAVSYENINTTHNEVLLLFWDELQDDYVKGTEQYSVKMTKSQVIGEINCLLFYSKGLAAKELTKDIYTRAYVEVNGKDYYSEVNKFSVLEYVYKMLEEGKPSEKLKSLLQNLLIYGGSAQNQFNFKLDKLASDTYYGIKVHNGKFSDGFNHGRYHKGDKVEITAEEKSGYKFSHWIDINGIIVSYDKKYEINVQIKNEYTAIYKDITSITNQLKMSKEIDYDTKLNEIDLPTAVSFEDNGETVVLDIIWDTTVFKETTIGAQKLYATLVDETAYEKYGISSNDIYIEITTLPFTFEINPENGEYILTGYYGKEEIVTVPAKYNNTVVSKIGEKAFNENLNITELIINNNIKEIERSAVYYCDNIETITIPFTGRTNNSDTYFGYIFGATSYSNQKDVLPLNLKNVKLSEGLTKIGSDAFNGCSSLTSITIPESVISIGWYAFKGCSSLKNVYYNGTLENWCNISFFDDSNPVYYSNNIYMKDQNDEYYEVIELTIPESITKIGAYQFSGFKMTNLEIPESVSNIGRGAFKGCSSLTSITIPESVISIGDRTFEDCSSLTSVIIPKGVTSIESSTFSNCSSLTSITIPESVISIGYSAFEYCSSLTSITIPEGVTTIENNVFYYCSNLTNVIIPEGVTTIGSYAFYDCSNLTNVIIPEGVTTIGSYAFYDCSNLTNVIIPESVTSIGESAFYGCSSLTNITIPNRVRSIGSGAFSGCSSLTSVIIPKGVTSIESSTFSNCSSLTSITIPEGVTTIGSYAFYNCSSLTSITIPEGVTTIGSGAFRGCSNLTSVIIPEGVTTIGSNVFYDCSNLTNVIIPESVTSIGEGAFRYCSSLISIIIPESVISIGDFAFQNCSSLTIYCKTNTIPNGWASRWNYSNCDVVWGYTEDNVL